MQVLSAMKMVVAPKNMPDDHLTEEEVLRLRKTISSCEAEDLTLLRILKSFHEGVLS